MSDLRCENFVDDWTAYWIGGQRTSVRCDRPATCVAKSINNKAAPSRALCDHCYEWGFNTGLAKGGWTRSLLPDQPAEVAGTVEWHVTNPPTSRASAEDSEQQPHDAAGGRDE